MCEIWTLLVTSSGRQATAAAIFWKPLMPFTCSNVAEFCNSWTYHSQAHDM